MAFLSLLAGIALLIVVWVIGRQAAKAEPAKLKRILAGIGLVLLAVVLGFVLLRTPLGAVIGGIAGLAAFLMRWLPRLAAGHRLYTRFKAAQGASPGQRSTVTTRFLALTLDHDTGALDGEVLEGAFKGCALADLAFDDLLRLLDECRADPQSVAVLEAYLDRVHGAAWRQQTGRRQAGTGAGTGAGADAGGGPMTRDEAYQILGLPPGADEATIRDAHRRLMKKLHPDQGGSNYLATKINQAKDLLLGA